MTAEAAFLKRKFPQGSLKGGSPHGEFANTVMKTHLADLVTLSTNCSCYRPPPCTPHPGFCLKLKRVFSEACSTFTDHPNQLTFVIGLIFLSWPPQSATLWPSSSGGFLATFLWCLPQSAALANRPFRAFPGARCPREPTTARSGHNIFSSCISTSMHISASR